MNREAEGVASETPERVHSRVFTPNVVALGVVSLLTDFSSEMIYPLLPLFLTRVLGAGPAFVGLIEGVAESTASFLKLASGWASDRWRRRKGLVLGGYALSSCVRPLVAAATAPWHVLAIRFADRVGKGVRTSPRDALLADSTDPDHLGRAFGFQRAMDHLGAAVGPLVAAGLLSGLGWDLRSVFWAAAVPALLSILVLGAGVTEVAPRPRPAAAPPGAAPRATSAVPRPFRRYLVMVVLFTLGNSSDAFLLLRAQEVGVGAAALPLLWAALHVVKSASSTPLGGLSDRWGRRRVIRLGWLLYAAVYAGLAVAPGPIALWALVLAYGVYYGFTEGVERALVADLVPSQARSTAYGWFHTAVGLAALPASLVAGALWQARGPAWAFGSGAALALGAAALLPAALGPSGE
ncbi:MAG TPA: MFS transporter [Candidatus Methylomirabilis sp.]